MLWAEEILNVCVAGSAQAAPDNIVSDKAISIPNHFIIISPENLAAPAPEIEQVDPCNLAQKPTDQNGMRGPLLPSQRKGGRRRFATAVGATPSLSRKRRATPGSTICHESVTLQN